ncbi:hypothetical protein [Alteribacter natronophilus]|uniref:hypothetical protein n=1 Tax=Alteribacter natronophilus TaxID=2583810 RepID=UPI00110F3C1D|nr:hypothetical protein [Alteribacter natronophilus]TMW70321.1 hypothetical protein FGB90_16735 [Alteribacter natronophilus]
MGKAALLILLILLFAACSDEVESEMNPNILDGEVSFDYTIPDLEGYLITAVDAASGEGEEERVDIYYVNEEDVGRNRQLMEMEEGYEEEFDIRRVYGPYEDFEDYRIVLIQSPYAFHEPFENETVVDGREFRYSVIASGETGFLSFQTEVNGIHIEVSVKKPEERLNESDVPEEISRIYKEISEGMN